MMLSVKIRYIKAWVFEVEKFTQSNSNNDKITVPKMAVNMGTKTLNDGQLPYGIFTAVYVPQ